nr:MAG TPA: hypothetical protein [Caudoviricetes sp.]DAX23376.1 MAG TPA: hypothetical protein [Caudoviricetes sp.]
MVSSFPKKSTVLVSCWLIFGNLNTGANDSTEDVVLGALLKRKLLIRNTAWMCLQFGIFDFAIDPAISNLILEPVGVAIFRTSIGILPLELDSFDSGFFLPVGSIIPGHLAIIAKSLAVRTISLMSEASNIFG